MQRAIAVVRGCCQTSAAQTGTRRQLPRQTQPLPASFYEHRFPQNVGGAVGAGSAQPSSYGEKTRTRLGAPFGSWSAVRVQRIRERAPPTPDDSQHESASKSV